MTPQTVDEARAWLDSLLGLTHEQEEQYLLALLAEARAEGKWHLLVCECEWVTTCHEAHTRRFRLGQCARCGGELTLRAQP